MGRGAGAGGGAAGWRLGGRRHGAEGAARQAAGPAAPAAGSLRFLGPPLVSGWGAALLDPARREGGEGGRVEMGGHMPGAALFGERVGLGWGFFACLFGFVVCVCVVGCGGLVLFCFFGGGCCSLFACLFFAFFVVVVIVWWW